MKNSMLLILLAIGGVIAYFVLGKRQPASQGTNTILGSTGSAQPAVTQSKAGKQRTDNTAAYLQAGAGLLSSIVGSLKSSSGAGASVSGKSDAPFGVDKLVPGGFKFFQNDARGTTDPNAPGVATSAIYGGGLISPALLGPPGTGGNLSEYSNGLNFGASDSGSSVDSLYTDTSADYGGELSSSSSGDSADYGGEL